MPEVLNPSREWLHTERLCRALREGHIIAVSLRHRQRGPRDGYVCPTSVGYFVTGAASLEKEPGEALQRACSYYGMGVMDFFVWR